MSKPTYEDKRKLEAKENRLNEMRTQGKMKRDVTVAVSAEGFFKTGIMCDIIQVPICTEMKYYDYFSSNYFSACNVGSSSSMSFKIPSFS